MKRILLSAGILLSMSLSAQVGVNTTSPEATLDVNGDVKVRKLESDINPSRVVTVGGDNVLRATAVSNGVFGVPTRGGGCCVSVGKVYECNSKNDGVIVFVNTGGVKCENNKWYYNGLYAIDTYGNNYDSPGSWNLMVNGSYGEPASFMSGVPYLIEQGNNSVTYPLQVIDDSQYR